MNEERINEMSNSTEMTAASAPDMVQNVAANVASEVVDKLPVPWPLKVFGLVLGIGGSAAVTYMVATKDERKAKKARQKMEDDYIKAQREKFRARLAELDAAADEAKSEAEQQEVEKLNEEEVEVIPPENEKKGGNDSKKKK